MKVLIVLGLIAYAAALKPSTHIVGGSEAPADAWPWQGGWLNGGSFSCGCSVLHANWIITAGHCVGGPVGGYSVEVGHITRGQGVRISVTSITIHPNYDSGYGGDGFTANDVAIVAATVPINGASVASVPGLDPGVERLTHTCFITGWGRTCGNCALPLNMMQTQIPVVEDDLCRERYPAAYNRTLHICLFDPVNQNVGSCNGDSGGPLVCRLDAAAPWELTGVTSWGTSGCPTTEPSVYARVSTYVSFICEQTNNEAPGC